MKTALKKLFPPPVASFMREIQNVLDSIWRAKGELSAQLDRMSRENEALRKQLDAQNEELRRLRELFESVIHERKLYAQEQDRLLHTLQNGITQRISQSESTLHRNMNNIKEQLFMKQDYLLDPALLPHALSLWYMDKTGRPLDLSKPKTYNEKIQWQKVYDQDPMRTQLADKFFARKWVAKKIGEEYLIPLLGVYDTANDIDFDVLPDSFVLKANHGCGWNLIVKDKSTANFTDIRNRINTWLQTNYSFVYGYEMQYSQITRRVIAEQYIENSGGDLYDYKFWCFNGKVHYIMFLADRQTELKMAFYDPHWNMVPISYDHPRYEKEVPKPSKLKTMIDLAEKLAEGFPHVRVDFYLLDDGTIKFGEMTFTSASGVCRWNPPSADLMLGKLLHLPCDEPEESI
jgi:hypothetical protein